MDKVCVIRLLRRSAPAWLPIIDEAKHNRKLRVKFPVSVNVVMYDKIISNRPDVKKWISLQWIEDTVNEMRDWTVVSRQTHTHVSNRKQSSDKWHWERKILTTESDMERIRKWPQTILKLMRDQIILHKAAERVTDVDHSASTRSNVVFQLWSNMWSLR